MFKYKFPVNDVRYGSKVVIYGAGDVGRDYLSQIVEYNLCELVCIVDVNAEGLSSDYVKIEKPEFLGECRFDYLIIAIKNPQIANEIKERIENQYPNIRNKIICNVTSSIYENKFCLLKRATPCPLDDEKICIAVNMVGGIGDAIFAKKVIMEFITLSDNECYIDIYAEKHLVHFVLGLYSDVPSVKNVYDSSVNGFSDIMDAYDLAIEPTYIFGLLQFKEDSLEKKNRNFYEVIVKIKDYLRANNLSYLHPTDNSVQFARAQKKGCNVYTNYSFDGLLPISDDKVNIPLLTDEQDLYKKIICNDSGVIVPFITVNYGWSFDATNVPSKIWPIEFFFELVGLIKTNFPKLHIVQLGKKNTPKIQGVDLFFNDIDIEVVKYILRDSVLHIDSEGGLVHIATQLGTKCLVAFGPTPVDFFGYKNNINVVSKKCNNCYYLDVNISKCIRGMSKPECMYSITPEIMFEKFKAFVKQGRRE